MKAKEFLKWVEKKSDFKIDDEKKAIALLGVYTKNDVMYYFDHPEADVITFEGISIEKDSNEPWNFIQYYGDGWENDDGEPATGDEIIALFSNP